MMTIDIPKLKCFLEELSRFIASNPDTRISIYEGDESFGLDKQKAGKLSEALIADGWAEVKILSGTIGKTQEGIQEAGKFGGDPSQDSPGTQGEGPVLDSTGRAAVESILIQMKSHMQQLRLDYEQIEDMVLDIKIIEIHLLSPCPKTTIVKGVLHGQSEIFYLVDKKFLFQMQV
jgi:hypothetical protein